MKKFTRCVNCEKEFTNANVFTVDGWNETQITGLCEKCFDDLLDDEKYEEDYEEEGSFIGDVF